MCGLGGYWNPRAPPTSEALQRVCTAMADTLVRRGPDASGVWVDATLGIGVAHRRLAIIDRSEAGAQPMVSADGRYVLVYNGELYNYGALRDAGREHGVQFRGHSDSEVLLETCARLGVRTAIEQFEGMFAFAIWDRRDRKLVLARDRLGIKPLYYGFLGGSAGDRLDACVGGRPAGGREMVADGVYADPEARIDGGAWPMVFGSELGAFRAAVPHWQAKVSPSARARYFDCGYVPAPLSIYQGIYKLAAGEMLEIDDDGHCRRQVYWHFADMASAAMRHPHSSQAAALSEIETCLEAAVDERMQADVDVGVLLSGGIDSSLVAAMMGRTAPGRVRSFSIGFDEPQYDESAAANNIAAYLGTRHQTLQTRVADVLALVEDLPTIADEPLADPALLPTALLARRLREHVVVALSGDGGDEAFAGYRRHVHAGWASRVTSAVPAAWRAKLAVGLSHLPIGDLARPASRFGVRWRAPAAAHDTSKFLRALRMHDLAGVYGQQLGPALTSRYGGGPSYGERLANGKEGVISPERQQWLNTLDPCARLQALDTIGYLPDDALTKIDRASMWSGVEVRVPFLDIDVLKAAWRVPSAWRVGRGRGKLLLRKLAARHLPPTVADASKRGLAVPVASWLRGPLRDWAEDLVSLPSLERAGVPMSDTVQELWRQHMAGRRDHADALWTVLTFVAWSRRWMAEPAEPAAASGERTMP